MKTIAHVGHTSTPGDSYRTATVMDWLDSKGLPFDYDKPDFIDLSRGRDFLLEDKDYSAVVLHHIFRGGGWANRFEALHRAEPAQLRISKESSWANWRKRLVATNAEFIFAFGGMAEVGGSFIVNLDGYESIQANSEFWVFKKVSR